MSYILDALKKADAERERGSVPGLHSQPIAVESDDSDDASARTQLPIVWIGAGAALCLIAVLSWQLLMREPAAPVASVAPAVIAGGAVPEPAAPPQATEPAQAPALPEQQAQPAPPDTPVNAMPRQPIAPPAGMAQPTQPSARNRYAAPAQTAAQAPKYPPEPVPSSHQGPGANANHAAGSPPAAASPRVPTLQELPDDIRREIPQLTIGGAMYSETPASRMLIVNSQVFHEGDKPYQGLVLEEIRLKSAVFSYRGYRYLVNY